MDDEKLKYQIGANIASYCKQAVECEKPRFLLCMVATFLWGMVAHAYAYFQNWFSHDAIGSIYATWNEEHWKIELGRIFVPIYRSVVRESVAFPWLIGLLALLWIGLSVYLVVRMFSLDSRIAIVLVSGIMTVNVTVTAVTATFLYELDFDMFALLAATGAAYLWNRHKWGWLPGMALVTLTLGLYQAYLSVVIVLAMLASIWALVRNKPASDVFWKGLAGIGMIIGGGLLYLVCLKLTIHFTGIELVDNYNGLSSILRLSPRAIPGLIAAAYRDCFYVITRPKFAYIGRSLRWANLGLLALICLMVLLTVLEKNMKPGAKCLFLVLLALLPLGMNISCVLSGGMVHDLMRYAFWLLYLLALLLVLHLKPFGSSIKIIWVRLTQIAVCGLIALILWNNTQLSNAAYLKRTLEQDASISLMTRLLDRLETLPGYVGGETPVVFVSAPAGMEMPGFETVYRISGVGTTNIISYNSFGLYSALFTYIFNTPIALDAPTWLSFQTDPRVAQMPSFPDAGSVQELDGVIVVKMGD